MRILLVAREFLPHIGGMETYAFELASYFKRAHDVFLITRIPDEVSDYRRRIDGVAIVPLLCDLADVDLGSVLRVCGSMKPDVVHILNAGLSYMVPALKAEGFKVVVTAHGKDFLHTWINVSKQKIISGMEAADAVIAVSEMVKKRLLLCGIGNNVEIIHHGTNVKLFRPKVPNNALTKMLQIPKGYKIILTTCRVVPMKNLEAVIRVLPLLKKTAFLIVGPFYDHSYLKKLKSKALRFKVSDRVTFLGPVEYEKLPQFYSLCDVFILPSTEPRKGDIESFGISFLEASSCGKPVVISSMAGGADIIKKEKMGIIVDPHNSASILHGLKTALFNRTLRKAMSRRAKTIVRGRFDWPVCAKKTLRIYQKLNH